MLAQAALNSASSNGLRRDAQQRRTHTPQRRCSQCTWRVAASRGEAGDAFSLPPGVALTASAAGREAAYRRLLDPVLSLLALNPDRQPGVQMARTLLRAPDPASEAASRAAELDERLFDTLRSCWNMSMKVFRGTPRHQDGIEYAAILLLDGVWTAAAESRAAAEEPELSLLKRLLQSWSQQERVRLLAPPAAVAALTSRNGLFFRLLEEEEARWRQQDAWGDTFLEGEKAARLQKLKVIRAEAQIRIADGSSLAA